MAPSNGSDVLAIVLHYNRYDFTSECLRALRLQSHRVDVLVLDNGSTDDSAARLAEEVKTKLLENTFRNVNIALINEFAQICDTLGVDVWEVVEAAKTKPFGFMPFYPGPGIGGHCIPLDPQYLVYRARLSGYEPRLVALADQINQEMPAYVVRRAMEVLNARGLAMRGANVLTVGVTYKADVPDLRESPALPVLRQLRRLGAKVAYVDPYVPDLVLDGVRVPRTDLTPEAVATADLVVLLTAHGTVDYGPLSHACAHVLDTRHVTSVPRDTTVTRHCPKS